MTEGQRRLYDVVKSNAWAFDALQNHTGGLFVFWNGYTRVEMSVEDVRYVLARLVLEGVKVNASLDA